MEIEEIINDMQGEGNIEAYEYFTLLDQRKILFNDECNDSIIEKVGIPLLRFNNDSSTDPVHLYINSNGGSTFASIYLCNIIDNYKKPLYIHVLGYALSMGFLLSCAGKNNPNVHKDCYPFTIFMMHAGQLGVDGTVAQAKSFMKFNEKFEAQVKEYVLSHTTIDEETYDKNNDDDYWMTSQEALEYGVIDEIIGGASNEK